MQRCIIFRPVSALVCNMASDIQVGESDIDLVSLVYRAMLNAECKQHVAESEIMLEPLQGLTRPTKTLRVGC